MEIETSNEKSFNARQWAVRVARGIICLSIAGLAINLCLKMQRIFDGPVSVTPTALSETRFNFSAAPIDTGPGEWELINEGQVAFIEFIPAAKLASTLTELSIRYASIKVPQKHFRFSSNLQDHDLINELGVAQHTVKIVTGPTNFLMAIANDESKVTFSAMRIGNDHCLVTVAADAGDEALSSNRRAVGIGLSFPSETSLIASRSTDEHGIDVQIVSVPSFNWEDSVNSWVIEGWTIETNPLANHNKIDAFCIKGKKVVRVWKIGVDSGRTILVLTKLQSEPT